MIINSSNIFNEIERKLLPKMIVTKVSFLCFINSDENNGLVLYSNNEFWKPYYYLEANKIKKLKLKEKTYNELISQINKTLPHENALIKKAKTDFFNEFETTVQTQKTSTFYELTLLDKDVVLTKHIVCIISSVDELERTFNRDNYICSVVPFKDLKNYKNKTIENWLEYFLTHAGEFI